MKKTLILLAMVIALVILPFFIKNRHSAIHMFFAYIVPFFSDKIE